MNEINDKILRIADDACAYLESQIKRLRSPMGDDKRRK